MLMILAIWYYGGLCIDSLDESFLDIKLLGNIAVNLLSWWLAIARTASVAWLNQTQSLEFDMNHFFFFC